jgi:hypothetical protein
MRKILYVRLISPQFSITPAGTWDIVYCGPQMVLDEILPLHFKTVAVFGSIYAAAWVWLLACLLTAPPWCSIWGNVCTI